MTPAIAEVIGWSISVGILFSCTLALWLPLRKSPTSDDKLPWREVAAVVLFVMTLLLSTVLVPFVFKALNDPETSSTLLK